MVYYTALYYVPINTLSSSARTKSFNITTRIHEFTRSSNSNNSSSSSIQTATTTTNVSTTHDISIDPILYNAIRNSEIYTAWLKRNAEDVKLYKLATILFAAQFEAALKLYASYSIEEKRSIKVPHCQPFL